MKWVYGILGLEGPSVIHLLIYLTNKEIEAQKDEMARSKIAM